MKTLPIVAGLLGGLTATGPMTIVMEWLHRRLPTDQKYPLPPREITDDIVRKAGADEAVDGDKRASLTLLNHFAYGAAAGVLYALSPGRRGRLCGAPSGLLFGIAVWVFSYFGLLPVTSVLSPASQHPAKRTVLMFAVHLVWGAILGLFYEVVVHERSQLRGALTANSPAPQKDRAHQPYDQTV